jgi:hypothetical protein
MSTANSGNLKLFSDFYKYHDYVEESGCPYERMNYFHFIGLVSTCARGFEWAALRWENFADVEDLDGNMITDDDGIPKSLRIWLPEAKGSDNAAGSFVTIQRNRFEPKFCLITQWLIVCNLFGWERGPVCQHKSRKKTEDWRLTFEGYMMGVGKFLDNLSCRSTQ